MIWGLLHTGVESHTSGVVLVLLAVVLAGGVTALLALRGVTTQGSLLQNAERDGPVNSGPSRDRLPN
ncbi:MAG: hypothetical protein U0794_04475 [Isosphaeraceae bacterium]